jgi:hypothetical protein
MQGQGIGLAQEHLAQAIICRSPKKQFIHFGITQIGVHQQRTPYELRECQSKFRAKLGPSLGWMCAENRKGCSSSPIAEAKQQFGAQTTQLLAAKTSGIVCVSKRSAGLYRRAFPNRYVPAPRPLAKCSFDDTTVLAVFFFVRGVIQSLIAREVWIGRFSAHLFGILPDNVDAVHVVSWRANSMNTIFAVFKMM